MPVPVQIILPAVLLVGAIVLVAPGGLLSLSTDVGLTDEGVCTSVGRNGAHAVERLQQTGFPHPTLDQVETYTLERDGTPEAAVRIDWPAQRASCVALDAAASATFSLSERAYGVLVGELRNVLETGHTSDRLLGNAFVVWIGTEVHIPGNEAFESAYERELAAWAAGRLAGGTA